jgi:hypothetical protein
MGCRVWLVGSWRWILTMGDGRLSRR